LLHLCYDPNSSHISGCKPAAYTPRCHKTAIRLYLEAQMTTYSTVYYQNQITQSVKNFTSWNPAIHYHVYNSLPWTIPYPSLNQPTYNFLKTNINIVPESTFVFLQVSHMDLMTNTMCASSTLLCMPTLLFLIWSC
jgi:hypothetical protein